MYVMTKNDLYVYLIFILIIGITLLIYSLDRKLLVGKVTKKAKCIDKFYRKAIPHETWAVYVCFQYEDVLFYVHDMTVYENVNIGDKLEFIFDKKIIHEDKQNPQNNKYRLIPDTLKYNNKKMRCIEIHDIDAFKEGCEKYR